MSESISHFSALPEAQFRTANCYADGFGVGEDQAEANEWYAKAAKQGYAPAALKLAQRLHAKSKAAGDDEDPDDDWPTLREAATWAQKVKSKLTDDEKAVLDGIKTYMKDSPKHQEVEDSPADEASGKEDPVDKDDDDESAGTSTDGGVAYTASVTSPGGDAEVPTHTVKTGTHSEL